MDPKNNEINQDDNIVQDEGAFFLSDEVSPGWEDVVAGYFSSPGE